MVMVVYNLLPNTVVFYPQFTSPVWYEKYQAPERSEKAPTFDIFTPDSL